MARGTPIQSRWPLTHTHSLSSKPPTPLPKAYSVTRYLNEYENIPVFIPRIGNPSAFRERRRYPSCAPRHFKRLF